MLYANGKPVGGGGGTGGHTIIDENGNSMSARAGLQFVGGANVSDDATNNKTIVDLASAGGIDGVFIDTGNVIVQETQISASGLTYTATEDCFVSLYIYSTNDVYVKIDNVYVVGNFSQVNGDRQTFLIPLKKGQTLTTTSGSTNNTYTVYGIQTGTTHSKFQPVIYSTEEREIGVWTDGKPLYQKSYIGLNVEIINVNTWYDTGLSASGVEVFVEGEMIDINNQAYPVNVAFMSSNTKIGISCGMANRTGVILTIRYTKTTDVAGSGTWTPQGVPAVHYSTDEQVIGTWIDGSTIYEKTYAVTALPNTTALDVTAPTDMNLLLDVKGRASASNGNQLVFPYTSSEASPAIVDAYFTIKNSIKYIEITTNFNATGFGGHLTIQYTKSS